LSQKQEPRHGSEMTLWTGIDANNQ